MNALLRAGAILICSQIIILATKAVHYYINQWFPESSEDKLIEGGVDKFVEYISSHHESELVNSNNSFVDIELN